MRRYVEPLLFGLATLVVQVGGNALLAWTVTWMGLGPTFLKWAAMGLLGSVAGRRGSRLGLLAIVAANIAFYGSMLALEPDSNPPIVASATLLYLVIAGVSYLVGSWLRGRQAAPSPPSRSPSARQITTNRPR